MMRFAHTVATGAGLLFAVPAVTLQGRDVRTLEEALAETTRALEGLVRIEADVKAGNPDGARALLMVTEPAALDERESDERMFALRQQINQLQIHLDSIEGAAVLSREGFDPSQLPAAAAEFSPTQPGAQPYTAPNGGFVATGPSLVDDGYSGALTARTLAAMREIRAPGTAEKPAVPEPTNDPVEAEGYSADALRQAKACLKAKLGEKGLSVLEGIEESGEVLLVRGRLYEQLGRLDEAVTAFDSIVRAEPDSALGKAAAEHLEFLVWRRDFERNLSGPSQAPAKSSQGGGS